MTKTVNVKAVSDRIRSRMQMRGLTVPRAAASCGMPVPTFETYLYAQHLPGAQSLADLCVGLGCTADWLLFGTVRP